MLVMSRLYHLISLSCLLGLSYAAPDQAITDVALPANQLTLWGTGTYSFKMDFSQGNNPTTMNYARLLATANMCFNSIKEQPTMTSGSGTQIALCACVGVLGQHEAFCGSVPRDDTSALLSYMVRHDTGADADAPRWEAAARAQGGDYWPHAEDYAYYKFEHATDLSGTPGSMYPDGTTIAVWTGRSQGDRGVGSAWIPCFPNDQNSKTPSCQEMANTLGVTYAPSNPYGNLYNPQGTAQPNTATDPNASASRARSLRIRNNFLNWARNATVKRGGDGPGPPPNDAPIDAPDQLKQDIVKLENNPPPAASYAPLPTVDIEDQYDAPSSTATQATSTGTGTGTGTITKGPTATPTCYLQGPDPDAGITDSACDCGKGTYPILSTTDGANVSEQCAYTSLPGSTTSLTGGLGPAKTYTSECQVCTRDTINEDSCSTISNCLPQTPKASVTAASSGMHVGTLTGAALYTSVSHALESICPPVTQTTSATECSGTAIIEKIDYVDADSLGTDGQLDVYVPWSSYNVTSLRDAMIKSLATTAQSSAHGKNCYSADYEVLIKRWTPRGNSSLVARDHPEPEFRSIELCNTAEVAQVNYYSQYWRTAEQPGATDYMEVQYTFHESGGGEFGCIFDEILMDALAALEPEFAVEEVELGEAIAVACEDLTAGGGGSD